MSPRQAIREYINGHSRAELLAVATGQLDSVTEIAALLAAATETRR